MLRGIFHVDMENEHWSPRSVTAYESLKELSKALFQLIRKYLNLGESVPQILEDKVTLHRDGSFITKPQLIPLWGRLALEKTKEIRELPEFAECVESMLADRVTQPFIPAETDASEYTSNQYILPFLLELIRRTDSPRFNPLAFDNLYQEIEKSLYSPVYVYRAWSTLENFSLPIDSLPFASNLRIKRFSRSEQEKRLQRALQPYGSTRPVDVLRTSFAVEMEHGIAKGGVIHLKEPTEAFGRVVSALRLFKPGVVGLGPIHQEGAYWQPHVVGTLSSSIYTVLFIGPTYELTEAEADQFVKFYNWLLSIDTSSDRSVELVIRRFNLAYERVMPADKLIDMMIAFEALLLPEKDELALRLSIRVANLLRDIADRQDTFKKMKKAYKLRSDAVHGGGINDEEISKSVQAMEELLRQSLRRVLKLIEQGQRLHRIISQLDDTTFT